MHPEHGKESGCKPKNRSAIRGLSLSEIHGTIIAHMIGTLGDRFCIICVLYYPNIGNISFSRRLLCYRRPCGPRLDPTISHLQTAV